MVKFHTSPTRSNRKGIETWLWILQNKTNKQQQQQKKKKKHHRDTRTTKKKKKKKKKCGRMVSNKL